MRKVEYTAESLDDAKIMAYKEGYTILYDATSAWKRNGAPILTKDLQRFAAYYMERKNMFGFEGSAIIISVSKCKPDTRKYPYHLTKHKRIGKRQVKKTIEIRKKSDDAVVATATHKDKAMTLAKKLVQEYKENLYGKTVYVVQDLDFEIDYTPSVKSKKGQYIVFVVDAVDVDLHKRRLYGFID